MSTQNQPSAEHRWVVGVDVAQKSLAVSYARWELNSLYQDLPVLTVSNDAAGFKQILHWLAQHQVDVSSSRMVLEHTSYYWKEAALFFYISGMQVAIASPKKVKNYRKALPLRAKTDPADACLIAYFAIGTPTTLWHPQEKYFIRLRQTLRARGTLLQQRTNVQLSYQSLKNQGTITKGVLKSIQRSMDELEKSAQALLAQAKAIVQEHAELKAIVEILRSIPGIGWITALGIVAELQGIPLVYSSKSTAAYAGVVPYPNESGESVKHKPHISRETNSYLRLYLYQASNSASRCNPKVSPLYQRLRAKGHSSISAKIACAHKLLMILLACVRSQSYFDPTHLPKEVLLSTQTA